MTKYYQCLNCGKEYPGRSGRKNLFHSLDCYFEWVSKNPNGNAKLKDIHPIFIREEMRKTGKVNIDESDFLKWMDTNRNSVIPIILKWLNGDADEPTQNIKTCPVCKKLFTGKFDQIFCDDPKCVKKVLPAHSVCLRSDGSRVMT